MKQLRILAIVGANLLGVVSQISVAGESVKVFILAGQSNVEGQGGWNC